MTAEISMRRNGCVLVPADDFAAEELARLPTGKDVLIKARMARNPRHLRLAWALAQKLSEATDFLPDRETAMEYLKIKSRHVRLVHDPRTGQLHILPKSINFASLDQIAFSRIFDRMVYVVCSEIMPGLSESDLRREIDEMCAPKDRGTSNAA